MNLTNDKYWNDEYSKGSDYRQLLTTDLDAILSHTKDTPTKKLLDVGCGTGHLTRDLFHRGYTCTGVDLSTTALSIAPRSTIFDNKGISYIQGDITSNEIIQKLDDQFSHITCKLVLAFIDDKQSFINQMASLLDENGSLVIITPIHTEQTQASTISVSKSDLLSHAKKSFASVNEINLGWVTCFIYSL